jgi:hypothetical protein
LSDPNIPQEYKAKVKIFSVKLKPKQQTKPMETLKTNLTKELSQSDNRVTQPQPREALVNQTDVTQNNDYSQQIAQGSIINVNNNVNNVHIEASNNILKIGDLEIQILDETNDWALIKIGEKRYKINKKDLRDLEGLKNLIEEAKIEYGTLKIKTFLGITQRIPLEPL